MGDDASVASTSRSGQVAALRRATLWALPVLIALVAAVCPAAAHASQIYCAGDCNDTVTTQHPPGGQGELGGYDSQELQAAYRIPDGVTPGETIALIVVGNYEQAEADLAKYRQRYGLSECSQASGCFRAVNAAGAEGTYPEAQGFEPASGWGPASAVGLDMLSTACSECRLLLVESSANSPSAIAQGVETAVAAGASVIATPYTIGSRCEEQFYGCGSLELQELKAAIGHASGVTVVAAAGGAGYGGIGFLGPFGGLAGGIPEAPAPADLPQVVAVGGTKLLRATNARGWQEEPWFEPPGRGTDAGCSAAETKPAWQRDSGCPHRTDNDVAAVAACVTPVSAYNSSHQEHGGWINVCGTSVSAALVAGIEAHSSPYARSLPGAEALYLDPAATLDITSGRDGICTPPAGTEYLCEAGTGYDGPTGVGVPNGAVTVEALPPIAVTGAASAVAGGDATLTGQVDPTGFEATYRFEYGTSTAYEMSAPTPPATAGSEASVTGKSVSLALEALRPDTTYHYRLVASDTAGTSYGADRTFRTAPPVVSAVSPATGGTSGDTEVTITGHNLAETSAVVFGSTPAASFHVESETSLTAVSPPGTGGADLLVTTPAGTSAANAGDRFTYQVGPVVDWGTNEEGQLGAGTLTWHSISGPEACPDGRNGVEPYACSLTPVEARGLHEVVAVASARSHRLALLKNGTVMSWGANYEGELGISLAIHATNEPTPVCLYEEYPCQPQNYLREVTEVVAGPDFNLALLKNGTVMSWGSDYSGELGYLIVPGNGAKALSAEPRPVCTRSKQPPCPAEDILDEVVEISAGEGPTDSGEEYALARLRNGTVMSWGSDGEGQLGQGESGEVSTSRARPVCTVSESPCSVQHQLAGVAQVAAGEHSIALLDNGTVMDWGRNIEGELGNGTVNQRSAVPTRVCAVAGAGAKAAPCPNGPFLESVKAIAGGSSLAGSGLALLEDGTVAAWGRELPSVQPFPPQVPERVCALGVTSCPNGPFLTEVQSISDDGPGEALLRNGTIASFGGTALDDGTAASDEAPELVCAVGVSSCPHGPYLEEVVAADGEVALLQGTPDVTGINPAVGSESGGAEVTITGAHLASATAVDFGSSSARFRVNSEHSLTAIAPPGSGTVDVAVTNPEGASATGAADRFTYFRVPTVTSVEADRGPTSGGTSVTITGTGLGAATEVDFGGRKAASSTVGSETTITAVSPPWGSGDAIAEVTVETPGGTSSYGVGDSFIYEPAVSSIEPTAGTASGGTRVLISGAAFEGGYLNGSAAASGFVRSVKFGATAARSFEVLGDGRIEAVAPAGVGAVGVAVETLGGGSLANPGALYTYLQPVPLSFAGWTVAGALTLTRPGLTIMLPQESLFNGTGSVNTETGIGSLIGSFSSPPSSATFKLLGFIPATLGTRLVQAGTLSGSLAPEGGGRELLRLLAQLNLEVSSVAMLGLRIPTHCVTSEPISLALAGSLTLEELAGVGWHFSGTASVPGMRCSGGLLGSAFGVVLSALLSGSGDPYSLSFLAGDPEDR